VRDPACVALCRTLGIRLPILLAPMAGGPSTPRLAAAVTRAGGLGVLGVTGMTADAVSAAVREARREAGGGAIGVNVQLAPRTPATGDPEAINQLLAPFRAELGLPRHPSDPPAADPPQALVDAALAAGAAVVSTFDDPAPVVAATRAAGARLVCMVTTTTEALAVVAAGADVVIAQGGEAGGHRGSFRVGVDGATAAATGLVALVPAVVDAISGAVPVVASGGIIDGRGIAAAFALGAGGVSLGT
jgi:nitronate monooxygenase